MTNIDGIARDRFPRDEHRATLLAFFTIVGPEIRPTTSNMLGDLLRVDRLTEAVAEAAFRSLWADDRMRTARLAWREEDRPLA